MPGQAGGAQRQCKVKAPDQVEALFEALPDQLDAVAATVRRWAPSAGLVFVDHLPLPPPTSGCADEVPSTDADTHGVRLTLDRLDTDIKKAAARAGALFVASGALGTGHDACSAAPYVAEYAPPVTPRWPSALA